VGRERRSVQQHVYEGGVCGIDEAGEGEKTRLFKRRI
jgi:hypothetical protein